MKTQILIFAVVGLLMGCNSDKEETGTAVNGQETSKDALPSLQDLIKLQSEAEKNPIISQCLLKTISNEDNLHNNGELKIECPEALKNDEVLVTVERIEYLKRERKALILRGLRTEKKITDGNVKSASHEKDLKKEIKLIKDVQKHYSLMIEDLEKGLANKAFEGKSLEELNLDIERLLKEIEDLGLVFSKDKEQKGMGLNLLLPQVENEEEMLKVVGVLFKNLKAFVKAYDASVEVKPLSENISNAEKDLYGKKLLSEMLLEEIEGKPENLLGDEGAATASEQFIETVDITVEMILDDIEEGAALLQYDEAKDIEEVI